VRPLAALRRHTHGCAAGGGTGAAPPRHTVRRVAKAAEDRARGRACESEVAARQARQAAVAAERGRAKRAEAVLLAAHAATIAERRRADVAGCAAHDCAAADRELRDAKKAIDRALAAAANCKGAERTRSVGAACLRTPAEDMVCGVRAACVSGIRGRACEPALRQGTPAPSGRSRKWHKPSRSSGRSAKVTCRAGIKTPVTICGRGSARLGANPAGNLIGRCSAARSPCGCAGSLRDTTPVQRALSKSVTSQ
jgi:hypothetical protein